MTDIAADRDIYIGGPEEPVTVEVVQSASAATAARLLARGDLVRHRGRYALANAALTPHQAMVEDLLFIRRALDAAGIGYLLVRGNDERPVLAVSWTDRRQLRESLAAACQDEPFYAKTVDVKKPVLGLVADGTLADTPKARIFRIFRPRLVPGSGLAFGAAAGIQLELWSFAAAEITLPIENSLTRRTIPARDAVRGTVERYGLHWPTIENMFSDHATDITFDIDLVFSWVDGSDPAWLAGVKGQMRHVQLGQGDDHEARFRQIEELRYALRSVYLFAPWIRRIFVATDSPRPAWLAEHPSVTLVRSADFFTDPSVLPTYNSMAVESQLHHIEGLAEHFLYFNDDVFFGRPVSPDMFFSPGGITRFVEATTRIGLGGTDPKRSGFENAARVNRRLLYERFGRITTRHLAHAPTALRRSVLAEMEREFSEEFTQTAASTFRASTNISVTCSLYHYYALVTGRAVLQEMAKVKYVDTTKRAALREMEVLLRRRNMDFFCLNDGSFPEIDDDLRTTAVTDFMKAYFPIPAPWENDSALT
ncbi:stealth family protein [Pseudarthrobacter sp. P1]|uniref:stealth family protein n=1 Tax=Pseudarthrobacter sp. P1 TaxID=3418418 RepID=UPI003CFA60C8